MQILTSLLLAPIVMLTILLALFFNRGVSKVVKLVISLPFVGAVPALYIALAAQSAETFFIGIAHRLSHKMILSDEVQETVCRAHASQLTQLMKLRELKLQIEMAEAFRKQAKAGGGEAVSQVLTDSGFEASIGYKGVNDGPFPDGVFHGWHNGGFAIKIVKCTATDDFAGYGDDFGVTSYEGLTNYVNLRSENGGPHEENEVNVGHTIPISGVQWQVWEVSPERDRVLLRLRSDS